MSRYLIELPERFIFSSEYRVTYSDINSSSHLGSDKILPIAIECQLNFIKALGFKDASVFEDAGLIMASSQIDYVSESFQGDELITDVAAINVGGKSFDLVYRISQQHSGNEVARVKARMLCFDYTLRKVVEVPQSFVDSISALAPL